MVEGDRAPLRWLASTWRELVTVVAACVAPFASFAMNNRLELLPVGRLATYCLCFTGLVVALFAGACSSRRVENPGRVAATLAALVLVFFNYSAFDWLDRPVAGGGDNARTSNGFDVWILVTVLFVSLVNLAARRKAVVNFVFYFAVLWALIPMFGLAAATLTTDGADSSDESSPFAVSVDESSPLNNVYVLILDQYARSDVLAEVGGYDNTEFLEALEERGFVVVEDAFANYPVTVLSIASMLEGDYVATTDSDIAEGVRPYHGFLKGDNRTVRTVKGMGYEYWYAEPGSESWLDCSTAYYDHCIKAIGGDSGLDSLELSLLRLTPLSTLNLHRSSYSTPGHLLDELDRQSAWGAEPFFLFAHLTSPHFPFNFNRDCSLRDNALDVAEDDPNYNRLYLEELSCLNEQLIDFVDRVRAVDPDGLILFTSDHGHLFTRGPGLIETMTTDELIARQGAMSAWSLPEGCELPDGRGPDLINYMPVILGCVAGDEPPLVESRWYWYWYGHTRLEKIERDGFPGLIAG